MPSIDPGLRIRELESALAEQQQRFDLALTAAGQSLWEWDLVTNRVARSPAWAAQLGAMQAPPDCDPTTFALNYHRDDREGIAERMRKAILGGDSGIDFSYRLRHQDGGWRWFSTRASIIRDAGGRAIRVIGLQSDISAERQREAANADTLSRYRSLYDNAPLAFVIWDREGRIIDWNARAAELFGHSRETAMGRRFVSLLFPAAVQDAFITKAHRLLRDGGAHNEEFDNVAADGERLRCAWHSVALKNARGNISGVLSLVQDLTMQWRTAESQRRDEIRNRSLIETSPDAIFLLNNNGVILYINHQGVRLLNADDSSDIVGTHAALWVATDEVDSFLANVIDEPGDRVGFIAHREVIVSGMDEVELLTDLNYTTLGDAEGNPNGMVLFARDITDKRRIENELQQHRDHLESLVAERTARLAEIIESSPLPTFVIGGDHRITHWNRACEQVIGGEASQMIGTRDSWRAFYPEARPVMADLVLDGNIERVENFYAGKYRRSSFVSGAFEAEDYFPALNRWLFFIAAPLHDLQGNVVGVIETLQDITERKEAEITLEKAKELAENAARTKADFLSNMSHEIRTPMNAVIGLAHLALRTTLTPRQRDYIERIKGSGDMLLGLLNDVLDLSKIEAGRMSMEEAPFILDDVLDSVATLVAGRARDKKLEFHFLVDPDVPQDLVGDSLRLTQVLVNLCGNAVKFTERGHVAVRIVINSRTADQLRLGFEIEDSGIGLTPEQASRLFQAFSQADTSTTRKFGGTGLGLIISKRIVELMHGSIGLTSQPGIGSRFQFDACFAPGPAATTHAERVPQLLQGASALIIDDHPLARAAMSNALQHLGLAVAALSEIPVDSTAISAGLVLIDSDLPSALECARALKKRSDAPRVIFLAGDDAEAIEAGATGSGVDEIISKPLTLSRLLRLFAALSGEPEARIEASRLAPAHFAGLRVLLAEDIVTNQMIATEMLGEYGLVVEIAGDGLQAVEKVLGDADYALVLMDIQMPGLDGIEATRRLRSAGKHLPIIAMTAHTMMEERDRCIAAGMDGFVTKPIDPDALLTLLMQHIPVATATAKNTHDSAPPPPAPVLATSRSLPTLPGIDTVTGLRQMMGKPVFYERILRDFYQRFSGVERCIEEALAADRLEEAKRQVHSIKSLAASIGAMALSAAAARLEQSIEAGSLSKTELILLANELAVVMNGLATAYGL
jgi:PAS domain S-box-containing protein